MNPQKLCRKFYFMLPYLSHLSHNGTAQFFINGKRSTLYCMGGFAIVICSRFFYKIRASFSTRDGNEELFVDKIESPCHALTIQTLSNRCISSYIALLQLIDGYEIPRKLKLIY